MVMGFGLVIMDFLPNYCVFKTQLEQWRRIQTYKNVIQSLYGDPGPQYWIKNARLLKVTKNLQQPLLNFQNNYFSWSWKHTMVSSLVMGLTLSFFSLFILSSVMFLYMQGIIYKREGLLYMVVQFLSYSIAQFCMYSVANDDPGRIKFCNLKEGLIALGVAFTFQLLAFMYGILFKKHIIEYLTWIQTPSQVASNQNSPVRQKSHQSYYQLIPINQIELNEKICSNNNNIFSNEKIQKLEKQNLELIVINKDNDKLNKKIEFDNTQNPMIKAENNKELLTNQSFQNLNEMVDLNVNLCSICYDNPSELTLIPCQHQNLCLFCLKNILKKSNKCCFCRGIIEKVVKDQCLWKVIKN